MLCSCREIERQYGDSDCKCVHYRERFPDCECENHSVSDHSPGLVGDDEVLIRELYSPHYINEDTGEVKPVAFRDARDRGLSVTRRLHSSERAHRAKIMKKVAADQAAGRNNDGFWRVVSGSCARIRGITGDDGRRLFCVYDTAREDDASHADVCQAIDPPPETVNRKSIRMKISSMLFEAFVGEVTDLEIVYRDAF